MSTINLMKQTFNALPKLTPVRFSKSNVLRYHLEIKRVLAGTQLTNRHVSKLNHKLSRCISYSCHLLKKNDKDPPESDKSSSDEHVRKALNDKEFQNILKDFSDDFEIGNRFDKISEDIKSDTEENDDVEDSKGNFPKDKSDSDKSLKSYDEIAQEKFKEFVDKDARIIYSFEEEQLGLYDQTETGYHITQEQEIKYEWEKAKRGITGVFDIEELVEVLRKENLFNICTISISKSLNYADFMVLASAKSPRHSRAVSEFILKLYKRKRHSKDPFIKIEGETVPSWKAIDMGNIVLHIFLEDTRVIYDIESLWLFDRDFDTGGITISDPMLQAIEEQLAFFNEMEVTEPEGLTKESS